jgi:DNA polymerase-3 subunit delta'
MARLLDQVIGHQPTIARALSAIESDRLAPTLLFTGPEGVGKRKIALGLTQALVCEKSKTACGMCPACLRVEKGSSESLLYVEPQGAQIKIEQARQIQDWLSFKSITKHRIVLINDAHKLNSQSSNSLLKTLEEPPENVFFFLIAPSQSSVLPTIRSRAQILKFGSLTNAELAKISSVDSWIVASSQGQASRLQSLAQAELNDFRKSSFQVFLSSLNNNVSQSFLQIKELAEDRDKALQIISFWQQFVRDLLYSKHGLAPLIHSDFDYYSFNEVEREGLEDLVALTFQAERDIGSNVDRILVLENLWRSTHEVMT